MKAKISAEIDPQPAEPANRRSWEIEILNRKGLAGALKCSLRKIDHLQAEGMPCVFIGTSRRFLLSEVVSWLRRKGGRR